MHAEKHAMDPIHNSAIIVYGIWHVLPFNLVLRSTHFSLSWQLLDKTYILQSLMLDIFFLMPANCVFAENMNKTKTLYELQLSSSTHTLRIQIALL